MTNSQLVPKQRSQNPEIMNFRKFPKKFILLDKREFKLPETRRAESLLPPSQPPFINRAWHLWYGIFPLASLSVCVAALPPSSCTPAHQLKIRNWKKSLIYSNNWKHQCCQHSSDTKSKTQQLLGGKLTLSQPKPGQSPDEDRTSL